MKELIQRTVNEVVGSTPAVSWSICVRKNDGTILAEHQPASSLPTASVGKILLLIEAARRIEAQPWSKDTV
jgi:beta-lactamase class A